MASHVSILVTGSRSASDPLPLWSALDRIVNSGVSSLSLFVGDCNVGDGKPDVGADRFAVDWWQDRFDASDAGVVTRTSPEFLCERWSTGPCGIVTLSVFYADWYPAGDGKLDKSAGPKRNSRTVAAFDSAPGEHRAFALWNGDAGGTLDTMRKLAKVKRGFEVIPC